MSRRSPDISVYFASSPVSRSSTDRVAPELAPSPPNLTCSFRSIANVRVLMATLPTKTRVSGRKRVLRPLTAAIVPATVPPRGGSLHHSARGTVSAGPLRSSGCQQSDPRAGDPPPASRPVASPVRRPATRRPDRRAPGPPPPHPESARTHSRSVGTSQPPGARGRGRRSSLRSAPARSASRTDHRSGRARPRAPAALPPERQFPRAAHPPLRSSLPTRGSPSRTPSARRAPQTLSPAPRAALRDQPLRASRLPPAQPSLHPSPTPRPRRPSAHPVQSCSSSSPIRRSSAIPCVNTGCDNKYLPKKRRHSGVVPHLGEQRDQLAQPRRLQYPQVLAMERPDGLVQLIEQLQAAPCDSRRHKAAVLAAPLALDQPGRFHPVEQPRRVRDHRDHALHDLGPAQPAVTRPTQDPKHVVLRRRDPVRLERLRERVLQHGPRSPDAQERLLLGAAERPGLPDLGAEVG